MVEPTCEKFHIWKENGMQVKFLRMDGAGKNKNLQRRAKSSDWKLNLNYDISARNTPQQNGGNWIHHHWKSWTRAHE